MTEWHDAELDPIRIAAIFCDLPALCRTFGWERPTAALDYLDPTESPELAMVVDLLRLCGLPAGPERDEAWRRFDQWSERTEALDRIAAAMV